MIIAAGVVVVAIGEPQHEDDGVFDGLTLRSFMPLPFSAKCHSPIRARREFDDFRLCQFSSKAIRHGASVLWFS